MTTTTISERSTGWIFYKRMWKMLLLAAAAAGYYSPAAVLLHAWIIITFFGQMTWWDRSKKWLIVSCTRVWGKECYLDILQCGMDLSLTDCYTLGDLRSQLSMQYSIHMYKIKLRIVTTGIPRLQRFLVARFHFARIFEAEVLYYKIMYFFDNFFWLYYDSHSANFT